MMKKLIFLLPIFVLMQLCTYAQTGIGTSTPDASAKLDVSSTTSGFLLPRMNHYQRTQIVSPAVGLIVWCNNCGTYGELQVYNGTAWTHVNGGAGSFAFPTVPNIDTATAVVGQAWVSFTQSSGNGGSAITSYTATSNPGNFTGTLAQAGSGTITVIGLTIGTAYTFTVTATNSVGTSAASAASNSVTPFSTIGATYLGGKLAYILQLNDPGYIAGETHGLIAAASDQSAGAQWGCDGTLITGADGIALGTGNQNTIDIMAGCATAGIAARLCGDLVLGGYSDWYLPSKDELNKLYINRGAVGGFSSSGYWSSSEGANAAAWYQYFVNAAQFSSSKGGAYCVRAVRAF